MPTEYRVVVRREDDTRRHFKTYRTKKGALRRMALYGPEPWTAYGEDPDAPVCCYGGNCGCGGMTVRQHHEERRRAHAPIAELRLEEREVKAWAPLLEEQP